MLESKGIMLSHRLKNNPSAALVLFTVWIFVIYSNTPGASFHYDDFSNIVNNRYIYWDEVSLENFKKLFIIDINNPYVRPVSSLTFALNYYFSGFDVSSYHYVNILIHTVTSVGFFLFTKALIDLDVKLRDRSQSIAYIAASLWLSSPLQTQAVTYIVQRMASLAAMFYVYAIYFYLMGRRCPEKKRYLFYCLTLICSLLAFGSKQNAYTLPLYLFLLEVIILRGGNIRFLFRKNILLASSIVAIIFMTIIFYFYYTPLDKEPGPWLIYLIKTRFFTGMRAIMFYINQLFFPVPSILNLEHDFQISRAIYDPPSTFLALFVVCGVLLYAVFFFKKYPLFFFFTIWFIGNLSLETFWPFLTPVFEHRLYLPSMGFFALVGIALDKITFTRAPKIFEWIAVLLLVSIFICFSVNTYNRNKVWKNEITLWSDVIKKNPEKAIGYVWLGTALLDKNDYEGASAHYLRAKSLEPMNQKVLFGLGVTFFLMKRYDEAVQEFKKLGYGGDVGLDGEKLVIHYLSQAAMDSYREGKISLALQILDSLLLCYPEEEAPKKLKERMERRTLAHEEFLQYE